MSTFLSRLKSNQGLGTNTQPTSPTKSKAQDAPSSTLDHTIESARPARNDGNDKSFGMHNPNYTCYANSVLQCLYFSETFRHSVLNFPIPVAPQPSIQSPALKPRSGPDTDDGQPTVAGAGAPSPLRIPADMRNAALQRSPLAAATSGTSAGNDKDSFDAFKKQIMASGPHIRADAPRHDHYGMPESLFTSLKDLFAAMIADQNRTGVVMPTKFMETLREKFADYRAPQHQDAHEFMNLLLNEVVDCVEDFSKARVKGEKQGNLASPVAQALAQSASSIRDMFQGTLTSETRCLSCENVSQRDEIFLDLSVDLEEHSSISSCLQRFSQEETLCENDKFHCDQCGKLQVAEKRMKIRKLPKTLALHMKRFKYVEESNGMLKLFHRVVFPFHLRLFNTTDDAEDPDRIYELYAVIVHLGTTPFHGHYVSIIKTKEQGWLLFDDELVLPVDANYVRNFFGGRTSACAYVLFYQETTVEAATMEQDRGQEGVTPHETNIVKSSLLSPTTPGLEESGFNFDTGSPQMRPISPGQRDLATTEQSLAEARTTKEPGASEELKDPQRSFELPPSLSGMFKSKDDKKSVDAAEQLALASSSQNGVSHNAEEPTRDTEEDKNSTLRHVAKKSGGGLSRFRTTSFSVRGRSRLFGSKGGDSKDQAEEQDSSEPSAPPPLPPPKHTQPAQHAQHEKGSFSMKTRPKMFGSSKSEKPEASAEAMEDDQSALEALLGSNSPSAIPPVIKHEKEKSSLSKLWGRGDRDKSHKNDSKEAPAPSDGVNSETRLNDSPEKPSRHVSSRFGLGRKKSGNPLI